MLALEYTSKFHQDMKKMKKRGKDKNKIKKIIYFLITKQKIPEKYKNENFYARLNSDGRITIPKLILERIEAKSGTVLEVTLSS